MKNRIIQMILILSIAILDLACKQEIVEIPPALDVNPISKNVDETANNFTANITSTITWTASSNCDWLKISPEEGEGNGTIKIEYYANSLITERTGTITIKGKDVADKTISITQKGKVVNLSVTPLTYPAPATIGTTNLIVTCNTNWTATSTEPNWLTCTANGTGNGSIQVNYSANNLLTQRSGIISVSANGINPINISIIQEGTTPKVTVITPTNSTNWQMYTTQNIQWTKNFTDNVKIELYKNSSFIQILDNSNSSNSFTWNIPLTLTAGNDYKIRIYSVANSNISNESGFFSLSNYTGTATDIDGNVYNTVQIGTQIWFKENLKVTRTTDGTTITTHYPDDNPANIDIYGRSYDWNTANQVCPIGWHLPSDNEWQQLSTYLGGNSISGGKLKEAGTVHWWSPNTGATNESNFTALPAGRWLSTNHGHDLKAGADFWTSTKSQTEIAGLVLLRYDNANFSLAQSAWIYDYFSIRCIKNQ